MLQKFSLLIVAGLMAIVLLTGCADNPMSGEESSTVIVEVTLPTVSPFERAIPWTLSDGNATMNVPVISKNYSFWVDYYPKGYEVHTDNGVYRIPFDGVYLTRFPDGSKDPWMLSRMHFYDGTTELNVTYSGESGVVTWALQKFEGGELNVSVKSPHLKIVVTPKEGKSFTDFVPEVKEGQFFDKTPLPFHFIRLVEVEF